jgi:hypothetical protein
MRVLPKPLSKSAGGWLPLDEPSLVLSVQSAPGVGSQFLIWSNSQDCVALFPASEFEIVDPIILPWRDETDLRSQLSNLGVRADKVHIITCGPLTRSEYYTARHAGPILRRVIPEYDFLHLNGIWDPMLWSAAKHARAAGKPYAVTIHAMLDP